MNQVKRPSIILRGKVYKARMPKVRAWRDFIAFETRTADIPAEEFLERMAALVASVFDEPVNAKMIVNELPIDQLRPLYKEIFEWIVFLVNGKMAELPNGGKGEAT